MEPFFATLTQDGLAECDQPGKNSLEIHRYDWELNPGHGEDRQGDLFILSLSYHGSGHREDRQ